MLLLIGIKYKASKPVESVYLYDCIYFCFSFYSSVMGRLCMQLRKRQKQPSLQQNMPYLVTKPPHLPTSPAKGKEEL